MVSICSQYHLNSVNLVCVITEQPGQGELPDLLQLLQGEAARPAPVLVEESAMEVS